MSDPMDKIDMDLAVLRVSVTETAGMHWKFS